MCTLYDFLSGKIRFIQTSTVTGSHSCSRKNYAYVPRTSRLMSSNRRNAPLQLVFSLFMLDDVELNHNGEQYLLVQMNEIA